MAPPYIRFARMWNEVRNVSNVQFYAANAEDLSWLESESFDIINYAYVLHEMPATNAFSIINEMYRLLKPGIKLFNNHERVHTSKGQNCQNKEQIDFQGAKYHDIAQWGI